MKNVPKYVVRPGYKITPVSRAATDAVINVADNKNEITIDIGPNENQHFGERCLLVIFVITVWPRFVSTFQPDHRITSLPKFFHSASGQRYKTLNEISC